MVGVIYIELDMVVFGILVIFNIMFGEFGMIVFEVYGLVFIIVYDIFVVVFGSVFVFFLELWIGNINEDLIGFFKDCYDDGCIDVVLICIDGFNVEGSGVIG